MTSGIARIVNNCWIESCCKNSGAREAQYPSKNAVLIWLIPIGFSEIIIIPARPMLSAQQDSFKILSFQALGFTTFLRENNITAIENIPYTPIMEPWP